MKIVIASLCLTTACHTEANLGLTQIEDAPMFAIPEALPTPLDVLVVLDDRTAMAAHLPRVPQPAGLGVLALIYNGAPDLRFAVTTTTTGTLRVSGAVPSGVIVHRLDFEDGRMETNYEGDLAWALSSLMNVGATSTAPNAAIESASLALVDDFVRPGAGVGILLVTASDDESPQDVSAYVDAIYAKGNRTLISAVHAGPAQRLAEFASSFPYHQFTTMESYNMEAVTIFSWLFQDVSSDTCIPIAATGGEPWAAEDLLACELFTSYNGVVNPFPMCNGSAWQSLTPCWQVVSESSCSSGKMMFLGGGYGMYHPRIEGRCAVRARSLPEGPIE